MLQEEGHNNVAQVGHHYFKASDGWLQEMAQHGEAGDTAEEKIEGWIICRLLFPLAGGSSAKSTYHSQGSLPPASWAVLAAPPSLSSLAHLTASWGNGSLPH